MKNYIVITGAEGFIGQYLVNKLCEDSNNEVFGIDNLSKHGVRRDVEHKNYTFLNVDILSKYYKPLVMDINPTLIIDLASVVGGINKINHANDVVTNINIFNQTFEIAQKLKTKYIFFSSSIVYDRINTFPTPELSIRDIPAPNSPYGYYKYTCEYLLEQSSLPYTIIRPYNCIGIGDDNEDYAHVFTDFIRQAKRNKEIIVNGGNQYRSFIHCQDVADIVSIIIKNIQRYRQIYNVGNPINYCSIQDLAYNIAHKCGLTYSDVILRDNPNVLIDVKQMLPNINKIKAEFDYTPRFSLSQSLDQCVRYYN